MSLTRPLDRDGSSLARGVWGRLEDLAEELGVVFEVGGEFFDALDGGRAEVVFHPLDVLVGHVFRDPQEVEKIGEELVFAGDVAGEFFAGGGEDEAAVFFVVEEALGIEALDHVGDAGLGDAEAAGDIDDAGVALGADELEDLFEVILDGGGSGA